MRVVIDIPEEYYEFFKDLRPAIIAGRGNGKTISYNVINAIRNGIPLDSVLDDVWLLYQRYQPRLATNVYEYGVELNELLHRYWDGGEKFTRANRRMEY